jgi:predicted amidohydrolase
MTRLLTTLCLTAGFLLVLTAPVSGEIVRQPVLAAIIQYRVQEPDRVGGDADRMEGFIREAALRGAKIVVTPETTFYRFGVWIQNGVTQLDLARNYDALVRRFGALSKELRICLVIGLRKPSGDTNLPTYNVAVFFGPEGTVLWENKKIILAHAEAGFTKSGSVERNVQVFQTPLGKTGMLICKDMDDDSTLPGTLVAQGMELFIGINADPGTGPPGRGWQKVYPACALGGVCYGIGANQIGANSGFFFNGGSGFVTPDKEVLSAAGYNGIPNDEQILYQTLQLPCSSSWCTTPRFNPAFLYLLLE